MALLIKQFKKFLKYKGKSSRKHRSSDRKKKMRRAQGKMIGRKTNTTGRNGRNPEGKPSWPKIHRKKAAAPPKKAPLPTQTIKHSFA
nr:hypothetical protein Iba_scaffold446CG0450 [Ipomoea batatas]